MSSSNFRDIFSSPQIKNVLDLMSQNNSVVILNNNKTQSVYYSNQNALELFENYTLTGKSIHSVKHTFGMFFKENMEQLNTYRKNKQTTNWLVIAKHDKSTGYKLFNVLDMPIWQNDELVGSHVTITEQRFSTLKNIMHLVTQAGCKLHTAYPNKKHAKLSPLENEILFLLLLGKSPKEISQIEEKIISRQINCSTISSIINKRIYAKLDAISVSTALQNALLNDDLVAIPENFLECIKNKWYLIEANDKTFNFAV